MLTLTKFFDENIYIYHTKNIHYEESNDIDSILKMLIFSPTYMIKVYIV
jgi:hypothetical protein